MDKKQFWMEKPIGQQKSLKFPKIYLKIKICDIFRRNFWFMILFQVFKPV